MSNKALQSTLLPGRYSASALALTAVLFLSACDNDEPEVVDQFPVTPPPVEETLKNDEFLELWSKLEQDPTRPPEFEVSPLELDAEVSVGRSLRHTFRIINVGDDIGKIEEIIVGSTAAGLDVAGTCFDFVAPDPVTEDQAARPAVSLERNESCKITIDYTPEEAGRLSSGIYVFTNITGAGRKLTIPFVIEAKLPQTVEKAEDVVEYKRDPLLDYIQAEHERRMRAGFGRPLNKSTATNSFATDPEVRRITKDKAYDGFDRVEAGLPVDRKMIMTPDRVIKAALETPIYSTMVSNIVAISTAHIYSPDNQNILIPIGTKFIGRVGGFEDERVGIVFERMITPDGRTVKMKSDVADQGSRPGVPGIIDRRFMDRYGVPLMLSAVSNTLGALADDGSSIVVVGSDGNVVETQSARQDAVDNFLDDAGEVFEDYLEEMRDIRSVVNVPAGTMIDIVPTQDIYFKNAREIVSVDGYEYQMERNDDLAEIAVDRPVSYEARPATNNDQIAAPAQGERFITIDGKTYRLTPSASGGRAGFGSTINEPQEVQPLSERREPPIGLEVPDSIRFAN